MVQTKELYINISSQKITKRETKEKKKKKGGERERRRGGRRGEVGEEEEEQMVQREENSKITDLNLLDICIYLENRVEYT